MSLSTVPRHQIRSMQADTRYTIGRQGPRRAVSSIEGSDADDLACRHNLVDDLDAVLFSPSQDGGFPITQTPVALPDLT